MNAESFVYWLNRFLEIGNPIEINPQQTQEIKNHRNTILRRPPNSFGRGIKIIFGTLTNRMCIL